MTHCCDEKKNGIFLRNSRYFWPFLRNIGGIIEIGLEVKTIVKRDLLEYSSYIFRVVC